MQKVFPEKQIYRIDHYLGKEPVQDIMALRFANIIFEPIWNRRYIDSVQITAAETVGVELRGGYYDNAGALRDMIQNHVMNLLALVAMEPPVAADADAIRDEKYKVLRAVRPIARRSASAWTPRAANTAAARSTASRCRPTAKNPTSGRIRTPRPTPRSNSGSTTGAGPTCPSSCAPENGWRARTPRSRSASARCRTGCSAKSATRSTTTCWS